MDTGKRFDGGVDVEEAMVEVEKNLNKISLDDLDDEIDIEKYAFRQDPVGAGKLQGQVTFVPVQRPHPQSWVFIPPEPEWRCSVAVIELKQQREVYLVKPEVALSLGDEVSHRLLVPYQDREGGLFLWPVRLTDSRGNMDSWSTSALRICQEFTNQWIKVKAKMSSGSYEVIIAPVPVPPPEWPDGGLKFLINRAFKNRIINDQNDPVVRKLRGLL